MSNYNDDDYFMNQDDEVGSVSDGYTADIDDDLSESDGFNDFAFTADDQEEVLVEENDKKKKAIKKK